MPLLIFALVAAFAVNSARASAAERPNVLFIAIDDLNDWIGALGGHPQAKTPNIDRLAERGVLFTNAHTQAPLCNPSRVSFMTGLLPSTTGVYQLAPDFRSVPALKDLVTIPQHFSAHGYRTFGAGKIFHNSFPDQVSFQVNGPRPDFGPYPKAKISFPIGHPLWDWGAFPETDEEMPDHQVASWFTEQLAKVESEPFFFAVGFYRPHVPLFAPAKWFQQLPVDSIQLPPVKDGDRKDLPGYAKMLTYGLPEPRHDWLVQHDKWKDLVRAYLACIRFVDHQVGRVVDALDAQGHGDDTIIVLFSDHGWHLGEKTRWGKRSLWERSTRVPLIIAGPGVRGGQRSSRPVGLVDLYPTLADLAGLPPNLGLDGASLAPLLQDPATPWNRPAITTFDRNNHTLRSDNWRYIRYADGSEELYDHRTDPNEWNNLANDPQHGSVIHDLARWLPKTNAEPVRGTDDPSPRIDPSDR